MEEDSDKYIHGRKQIWTKQSVHVLGVFTEACIGEESTKTMASLCDIQGEQDALQRKVEREIKRDR